MTQKSYFHNGLTRGDATEAPYSSALFADLFNKVIATDGGYVLPNVANYLEVTAGAGRSVDVASGSALVYGWYYNNSATENISIPTNTTSEPRIDRIILRYSATTQTVRLALLSGTPAIIPEPPELTNTDTIKEISLAYVYLEPGYTSISDTNVFDERQFANNVYHINNYSLDNKMFNPEWVVFSGEDSASTIPPDGWETDSVSATFVSTDRMAHQQRGRAISVSLDDTKYLRTTVLTSENFTDYFTLAVWVHVTTGQVNLSFGGITKYLRPTNDYVRVIIRANTTGYQNIAFTANGNSTFKIGPISLVHGLIPKEGSVYEEVILFDRPVSSNVAVLNGTSTSSFNTTHTLSSWGNNTDFQSVMEGYRALIIRIRASDTGSYAGSPVYVALKDYTDLTTWLRCDLEGIPNSTERSVVGYVVFRRAGTPIDTSGVTVEAKASGTNTLTIYIEIIGAVI